jgi:hypothetical protein
MGPSRRRLTLFGIVWPLLLAGAILAHRAGVLPAWVYQGRFRDEVLRRTGTDLADRSAPKPILDVSRVDGEGGRRPRLVLDVKNVSDTVVTRVEMWARFHLATEDAGWSPTTEVAGYRLGPMKPGETRRVTLQATTPQGLGITTRGPLLTANIYWSFSTVQEHRRGKYAPRLYAVRVAD